MPDPDIQEREQTSMPRERDTSEENLPAVQENIKVNAPHPEVQHFGTDIDPKSVIEDTAKYSTFHMRVLEQLWAHANSFVRVAKLVKLQQETLKFRSDNLGIHNDSKGNSDKTVEFTPID